MSASQVFSHQSVAPTIDRPSWSWMQGGDAQPVRTLEGGGVDAIAASSSSNNNGAMSDAYTNSFEDLLRSRLVAHEEVLRQQRKQINDSRVSWLSPPAKKTTSHHGRTSSPSPNKTLSSGAAGGGGGGSRFTSSYQHHHESTNHHKGGHNRGGGESSSGGGGTSSQQPQHLFQGGLGEYSRRLSSMNTANSRSLSNTIHNPSTRKADSSPSPKRVSAGGQFDKYVEGENKNRNEGSGNEGSYHNRTTMMAERPRSQQQVHPRRASSSGVQQQLLSREGGRGGGGAVVNPKALNRRHTIEEEIGSQNPGRPVISITSEELAKKHRASRGVEGLPIEESLLTREEIARVGRMEKAEQIAREEVPGVPRINPLSSLMGTDDPMEVYERLYADSSSKSLHLETLTRELKRLVEANVESTFSPAITPRARNMVRKETHTAHGDLFDQAKKQQEVKKRKERQRELEAAKAARSRTPQVNPMSRLIASRLEESTHERLMRRPTRHSDSDYQSVTTPRGGGRTVAGTPSRTTGHAAVDTWNEYRRGGGDSLASSPNRKISSRILGLYQDHARRETRRLVAHGEKSNELPDDCTFAPHITPFNGQSAGGASSMYINSDLSVADRMRVWDDRRKSRIAKEANERAKEELVGCTFEPSINPTSIIIEPDEPHHGYEKFIARHDRARKEAQEVSAIREGSSWRGNAPTTYPTSNTPRRKAPIEAATPVDKDVLQRAIEALNRAKKASRHQAPAAAASVPSGSIPLHSSTAPTSYTDPYAYGGDPYNL